MSDSQIAAWNRRENLLQLSGLVANDSHLGKDCHLFHLGALPFPFLSLWPSGIAQQVISDPPNIFIYFIFSLSELY